MALSSRRMAVPTQILLTLMLWSGVLSVDRSKFKTCDQSGFCKRQRAMQPGQSPYVALLDTVQADPTKISLDLINTNNNVLLKLELIALQNNMARLKINEATPLKARYEPPLGDVLVGEPKQEDLHVDKRDDNSISLAFLKNRVLLQAKPFRIDFVVDDEPVISVNARGLMKFEHLRTKSPGIVDSIGSKVYSWFSNPFRASEPKEGEENQQEENEGEKKEEEEPDMWEETYSSHTDSKPNGPESIGMDFSFPGFDHVYGLPEHADSLQLKSTKGEDPYRLYNLDVFEYEVNNKMALYGAVPLVLAHNEKRTVGLFWLNTAETWVDVGSNTADKTVFSKMVDFVKGDQEIPQVDTHWFSESGIIDVFFMLGPSAKNVFSQYGSLTGVTPLPPLFAMAYHQCRWNYNDQDDVARVNAGFDEHDIPMDVIWLDIEHTDGKRYFTWDGDKFSHSIEMVQNVSAAGRKMVTIVDPHIKKDDNYKIHKECTAAGHYIKNKDGNDYEGWCWPGSSAWPDYTNPEVRKYWAQKFDLSEYDGSTLDLFTWNDMNEPSVFSGPEVTMHKDAVHHGGWEHRAVHNLYGTLVHRATVEGLIERTGGKERPFVLSRAFFAGSQRYGAVWTGDNSADWSHLKISMPMILELNIAGITFSGADVGGFFKNTDDELLTRWYQAGAFQPFFRAHAHLDTKRREPWLFPERNLNAIRTAIRTRYMFLPFWYTLFYFGEIEGGPVMRPLWTEFPKDRTTFSIDDSYMLGSSVLVRPVTDPGATSVTLYFPGDQEIYYDKDTSQVYHSGQTGTIPVDLEKIPVFYRGGSIIPLRERVRRSASLGRDDPFTLLIALDKQGSANGHLYIDDYHSFNYQKGEYILRRFTYENNVLKNSDADSSSTYRTNAWLERVIVLGVQRKPSKVELRGTAGTTELQFKYYISSKKLVVRKPSVNIANDWTISIQ